MIFIMMIESCNTEYDDDDDDNDNDDDDDVSNGI